MAKSKGKEYFTPKGEPVPASAVSAEDKKKDKVVCKIGEKAWHLMNALLEFKRDAYAKCDELYTARLESKGIDAEDRKGNFTLYSYDKSIKIEMNISSIIKFNDDIAIAQEKIHDYLEVVTEDASDELRTIVRHAFTTSRNHLDKAKVLSLFRYQIKHPDWLEAMELIKSAIEVADSRRYMTFSVRNEEGEYIPIQLNFASL